MEQVMQAECPLCGRHFPVTLIETHAWYCSGNSPNEEGL